MACTHILMHTRTYTHIACTHTHTYVHNISQPTESSAVEILEPKIEYDEKNAEHTEPQSIDNET